MIRVLVLAQLGERQNGVAGAIEAALATCGLDARVEFPAAPGRAGRPHLAVIVGGAASSAPEVPEIPILPPVELVPEPGEVFTYVTRGPASDVHVHDDPDDVRILCVRCTLEHLETFSAGTPDEMLEHLAAHRARGDQVPEPVLERLRLEIEKARRGWLLIEASRRVQGDTEHRHEGAEIVRDPFDRLPLADPREYIERELARLGHPGVSLGVVRCAACGLLFVGAQHGETWRDWRDHFEVR